ncbi:SusC/RagA family TonB-linked outer membrane protein [Chryseobacterium elymi]|uniref:SusC/RagA family TonB-linked outer membrane protein n=1 Tax=Chryseobacterium elymi TaxID=395936 RepID=A0A3D9DNB2_9FLAO|nr:SusC/RagA family TonB-linked outer membrane protein [Chryseobacterium elymi]REC79497.1 SusC/RagA family TonB-linked outer membrane protein [Chryseobacterium elymi]
MKILYKAAVFFLIGWQSVSAQQNLPKMRVNYDAESLPADAAIELFLKKNKIQQFAYSKELLKNYKVQRVKCQNELVLDCLAKLFKDLPLETSIYNNSIVIREKKSKPVSTNEEFSPMLIAKRDTIKNTAEVNKIDEIVVNAGYYTVRAKEQTGSIAKVTAKDIENQPVTNVLSTIQGRMSGVNITQGTGVPGGGFDIQIRGRNSLRNLSNSDMDGNQPLYVIDGIPVANETASKYSGVILPGAKISPLNSINPNDIESIEILKDADATAIYGSRGANGVILITTKKGKSGRLGLNFNTSYGLSSVLSNLKMMNTEQYYAMRTQAYSNVGTINYPSTAYDVNGAWDRNRYTDWSKTLIGNTASFSSTQLSLNGGNNNTKFLLSLGHNEQTTVFGRDFRYVSNNITNNISHNSADNRFQLNLSNIVSFQKNNVVRADVTRLSFTLSPNAPAIYNVDGSINWENNTFSNPVAAYNSTYSNQTKQFLTNLNVQYEVIKNFRLKLNGGFNYNTFDEIALQPNTMYNPALVVGSSSAYSRSSKNNQNTFSFIVEPQINYSFQIDNHKIDFLVGGTFQKQSINQGAMEGVGFESNSFISNIGAAQTKTIFDQIDTKYKYAAIFGRIHYKYKDRYILNITGRRDGSSRFGPNNKFANFGAIGGAWIFSKEQFVNDSQWLSFGKLRASFGTAGSDNIGDYQYINTYTVSSLIYNSTTGLLPSRLFNPDYSWEKTTKLETALELGFIKNKINVTASWYRNRSSNQLVGYQLPAITGFPTVLANLDAEVENTGLEFDLTMRPFSGKEFKWESSFNLSIPKNKLISFPGLEGSTYSNQYVIGQPISIIKVYQLEGINPQTGLYQFTDFNKDGKISSPEDNQVVEKIGVKFFGGWNNTISYKNWDLSFLIQFVNQRNKNYNSIMPIPGGMTNQPIEVLDVWSPQNPTGFYMPYRPSSSPAHTQFQNSTASISDASFIRLKNLQIGYRIPLESTSISNAKIYFQGQNLITWTKYFGVDPEFLFMGYLPPLRTYSLGFQFNF